MKRFALWAVLMLCAGTAGAQSVLGWGATARPPGQTATNPQGAVKVQIVGGVNPADSSGVPLQFTSAGYLKFLEMAKDRDNYQVVNICDDTVSVADLIDTKSTAGQVWTAESSLTVTPCYNYRHFTLCMRVIPQGSDTLSRFRFAVQIRKHTDASYDSSSTFAWTSWAVGTGSSLMTTAGDDSTGHFNPAVFWEGTGKATGAGPWSNERVFVFDGERGNGGISAAASIAQSFGWPGGIAVDLCDARGQWFWGYGITVRIRCLSNGRTTINKPRIIAKLIMGS